MIKKEKIISKILNGSFNGLCIYWLFNNINSIIGKTPTFKLPILLAGILGLVFDWNENALMGATILSIVLSKLNVCF